MAYQDDLLNAAQRRRTRTGNSYFPAANTYRGININALPNPDPVTAGRGQIIQMSGEGSVYSGAQTGGYGPGRGALPPDQNPAYQASISRPRSSSGLTMINSPQGGSMGVTSGQLQKYLNKGYTIASPILSPANAAIQKSDLSAAYAKGYGAAAPFIQNSYTPVTRPSSALVPGGVDFTQLSGQQLVQGGVANPVENLTPQQRVQYGVGTPLDRIQTNPSLNYAVNALSGFGRNIASWFGGGNIPSVPPSANAGVPSPSPTPYQTPVPSPTPTATPFKTASDQSDLLRETEGTFYGGGQAPIPTPTPSPGPNRYVLGQPRRYSDYFGYS